MNNPLLSMQGLPPFTQIRVEHIVPAIDALLAENRQRVGELLDATAHYTWENFLAPLEALEDRLNRAWSPVSHLNAVMNAEAWRGAYNACLPKLSNYATEMGQNERLFRAYKAVAEGPGAPALDDAQRKLLEIALRDFRLSGIDLPADKQARFKEIVQELSRLSSKFSENVLDATDAWKKHITDEGQLAGLPDTVKGLLRQNAQHAQQEGWLISLDYPSYVGVMTYADDRALRAEVYTAYVTRASDEGPHASRWDNTPLINEILRLRHEKAQLLGFAHYAEYSLATKMAGSTAQVMGFLQDLATRSLPIARKDMDELHQFAAICGVADLEAWDVLYYSEKLCQDRYAISQEELKPYFPVNKVLSGMFSLVEHLYGMRISERKDVDIWHPDVRFFEIRDYRDVLRGQFYLDLYARPHKRGGAWMDDCMGRRRNEQGIQTPVAYLVCNFSPPIGTDPALLTHDEVLTLFHEFGHGLHHMLTRVDYLSVAGISGVPWDAVELPSQFMENWCWVRDVVDLISGHYKTGEPLPQSLFEKLTKAKNFQSAMQMVRQLEFAIFDLRIHMEYDPASGSNVMQVLDEVRKQVAVVRPPSFSRFPHSFGHVFSGGYAAGYYSYKWAEVLSSDAFAAFEEKGLFDKETGLRFLSTILEQGGSRDPMDLFIEFRGREPQIDALLRHSGISAQ
jgi:oligopeptidase A